MSASKVHRVGIAGKHKAKADPRTINFSSHISMEHLPAAPGAFSWSNKKRSRWGAMKNMEIADCTFAAAGHLIQTWTMHAAEELIIPDRHIVKGYSAVSGYVPGKADTDVGAPALDVLKHWRKNGIGGHKIIAFASVDHSDKKLIAQSIYLFGGLFAGLQLPNTIRGKKVWDITASGLKGKGKPGSFGGHAVTLLDYDEHGLTIISWGKKKRMTWNFWHAYAEEAYVVLSSEFLKHNRSFTGLNLSSLEKQLMAVTGQKVKLSKQLKKGPVDAR